MLPNHVHVLLRADRAGLSRLMQRALGGYAGAFNRRHRRHGHLFQNRFKSLVVEDEPDLLELVRYIHLNPLRAGLVADLDALDRVLHVTPRAVVRTLGGGARLADQLSLHFPPLV